VAVSAIASKIEFRTQDTIILRWATPLHRSTQIDAEAYILQGDPMCVLPNLADVRRVGGSDARIP
jgi:hypothetical protein